jgi:CHAT domain-containing protein
MRLLEDHLSPQELASLPESPEALASGGPEEKELRDHLQQCEACRALAQAHWTLRSFSARGSDAQEPCPEETVWLEVAAGLRQEQSLALSAHAAKCAACGPRLRQALDCIGPAHSDSAAMEAETIDGLASSKDEWQRAVAAKMMAAAGDKKGYTKAANSGDKRIRRGWPQFTWRPVAIAAVIMIAIFLTFGVRRFEHPSEARLLALAYNKQRWLVLRIPGADPVPMASETRGAGEIAEPSELLELKLRAQRHLDRTPESAYWHQVRGEAELLEREPEPEPEQEQNKVPSPSAAALSDLNFALASDPNLPNLTADLAAADFENAEATGKPHLYSEAANLYNRLLSDHPSDPALLYYNLGLCYERLHSKPNAEKAFEEALALERSASWRQAIQTEMAKLSAQSATTSNDGFEAAQTEAIETLLPQWLASSSARERILQIASLGLRHGDHWLMDWIHGPHTAASNEADLQLAAAVTGGLAAGLADSSLAEARTAIGLYRKSGNAVGELRARQAELFALQRLGYTLDCLAHAASLQRAPGLRMYARMQIQVLLDEGSCAGRNGDFAAARSDFVRAEAVAAAARLPLGRITALRAHGELMQDLGMKSTAWREESSAAGACEEIHCGPGANYAVLYDMVLSALDLGDTRVAEDLMRTATEYARASGNQATYAFAIEKLATLAGQDGNYSEAESDFDRVFAIARASKQESMARRYDALWQTDEAEMLLNQGKVQQALSVLAESALAFQAKDPPPGRADFFERLAMAQLALGHSDDALRYANQAVAEAEGPLRTIISPFERIEWAKENAGVNEELVEVHLQRGDDSAALQAWERFRAAPFTNRITAEVAQTPDTRIVVVARVHGRYIGWLTKPGSAAVLNTVQLGESDRLQQMAQTFYRLCASRDSSVEDIRSLGSRLYATVLGPLIEASEIEGNQESRHLWIELDSSLRMLPLAALTTPDGQWLGQSKEITVLPAWWSLDPASALAEPGISADAHLLVLNGFGAGNDESEAADLRKMFPRATEMDGTSSATEAILEGLQTTEIFHFSGHADSAAQGELLLKAADPQQHSSLTAQMLTPVNMSRCRLGVLAACNTTSADPDEIEELPDLRDALLLAGVHTVAATSWDIDDRGSRLLMLAFYEHLKTGLTPARALQAAQQSLCLTPQWHHPYYWASFEIFNR